MEAEAVQRTSLTLSPEEVKAASGGYRYASRQIVELHKLGFHRATLDKNGHVRLERAHYEAVCRGTVERPRPKVKPVTAVERTRPTVKPISAVN